MSTKMKLIMENWRNHLLSEQDQLSTVGDLRNALQAAVRAKKQGIAADKLKSTAVDILLDLVPGASTMKSMGELFLSVYKLPDGKRNNTTLVNLDVDDDVSAVVDDAVENQFLKDTIEMLNTLPDDTPIEDLNMTKRLGKYIAGKYNQTVVDKEV